MTDIKMKSLQYENDMLRNDHTSMRNEINRLHDQNDLLKRILLLTHPELKDCPMTDMAIKQWNIFFNKYPE
jgi:hypothetical protein